MARAGRNISNTIKDWNKKVDSTGKWVEKQVEENYISGGLILGVIKWRLWTRGESGDGTILPPYSPYYIKYRKLLGKRTSPTSLKLSGDWYDSLFVKFGQLKGTRHIIEVVPRGSAINEPEKTTYLKRRYGASILTLNEKEQQAVVDRLSEEYVKLFEDEIILGEL